MSYMASLPNAPLSEEQYLDIERQAETKSEFHDGQMFAMADRSANHALLGARIGSLLYYQMPSECRVYSSSLRIKAGALYTYADYCVISSRPHCFGDQKEVVTNPVLIVEVLSPSTEGYDRGKKFESCRTIESFREYLLIHQDRRHVEHYSKQDDGSWVLREHSGADATVGIARPRVEISLGELYASALDID
jgi:Uma2 family endonuclease